MNHEPRDRLAAWAFGCWPLLLLALATGCATVTPYQPLAGGLGYSEQKIESNRWRVTYVASARTPATAVDNYLLYRAAEITLANGHDTFVVLQKTMQQRHPDDSGMRIGIGGFGGSGGSGIGIGFGTGVGDGPPWQAYMEFVTQAGPRVAEDLSAFDARSLKENLEPGLQRPAPPP